MTIYLHIVLVVTLLISPLGLPTAALALTSDEPIKNYSSLDSKSGDKGKSDAKLGADEINQEVTAFMKKWELPGGQFSVIKKGRIIYSDAFGFSDKAKKQPMATDNIFRIASVSKVFTACAIWQLIEAGKLKIDDRAFEILSDLKPLDGAQIDPRLKTVTIKNLLEHTGGWTLEKGEPQAAYTRLAADLFHEPRPARPVTIVRYMMGQPLDYDPGSKSVYSNFGYNVLGRVIEKVSGLSYGNYVQKNILQPSGIADMALGHTSFSQALPREVYYDAGKDQSEVWSALDNEPLQVSPPFGGDAVIECLDSHGGWVASADDLVKFGAALSGTAGSAKLLQADTFKAMLRPSKFELSTTKGAFRAGGFSVCPGRYRWSHAGALVGTSSILVDLGDGIIYACLFNHLPTDYVSYFGDMEKTFAPLAKKIADLNN